MATIQGTDYTKRKKDALIIKLPDGEGGDGFELSILPPTKGVHDRLVALAEAIDGVLDGKLEAGEFDYSMAAETVAAAMSRNAQLRAVTPGFLEGIGFDITDIADFIASYIIFISKLVDEKN